MVVSVLRVLGGFSGDRNVYVVSSIGQFVKLWEVPVEPKGNVEALCVQYVSVHSWRETKNI
jgi:hypothetical protein